MAGPGKTTDQGLLYESGAGAGGNKGGEPSEDRQAPGAIALLQKSNSPYLDVGDNVNANVQTCVASKVIAFNPEEWLFNNCSEEDWFIPGECENGHRVGKVSICGKEWCPVCGEKHSVAHNRRFVRWLPKIQQLKRMRYMVFTIPEGIRANFRTKESLTRLGRQVQALLKAQGFTRGLRRWHWFGDKSHKWHPHLNVLVEGGYMNGATLQTIKAGYAALLGVKTVSVRTSYKPRPADMAGSLYYVTRATFHDVEWDREMALELHNFRNMVVWGKGFWTDPPAWQLEKHELKAIAGEKINVEAVNKLAVEKVCPVCGSHVTWKHALPGRILRLSDTESLGAGYYMAADRPPPPLEDTLALKLAFFTGKHGEDGGILRHYVNKVRGHEDEIAEAKFEEAQDRKAKSHHSWYADQLAWIEVAAEMDAEKEKHAL